MATPVVVVASGGLPVTVVEGDIGGTPMTISENGYGIAVTVVASGGLPVSGIVTGPSIAISDIVVYESAAIGTPVGTLSVENGDGIYTWTMTNTAGGKFTLDGAVIETAAALDYEIAASHVVTVEADNGVDDPISRDITITVINVELEDVACISEADDPVPDFEFDLPPEAEAGMVITAEVSDAGAETWTNYFDHTLTAGEIIADTITVFGVTPLDEGTYDFRFQLDGGAWSVLENIPINFAPEISTLSPTDGATSVAVDGTLTVTFDRNIQFGTGDLNIYKSDDTLFENFDVVTHAGTKLTIAGAVLTINPAGTLANSTDYYVQIDPTAIQNVDEIAFAGIADETSWTFTTVAGVTAYELKVDTFYSSGTFTAPADIRSNQVRYVECWAAGGAGVADVGAGGGGAYSRGENTAVTPSTGYAVAVGTGAVGANGGNSTFNSTTVVAEGGKAGNAGASGGLAANGTGTVKYSGGNGSTGTGVQPGGTSAGSAGSSASASFGGPPDGAGQPASGGTATAWGGGTRTTASLGGAGARGHARVTYEVPATALYPYTVGRKGSRNLNVTAATTMSVTYPTVNGGIQAGDLCLVAVGTNFSSSYTLTLAGFTEIDIDTNSTNFQARLFSKTAAGGEDGTTVTLTSSTAILAAALMLVIRHAGTPATSSANGLSAAPAPPLLNPGTVANRLWLSILAACTDGLSGLSPPTVASSGFGNIYIQPQYGAHLQVCELRDTVASKTPGTHTMTSEQWVTFTVAIPYA